MKKDLVVKQSSATDCGACCLLSIIKFYEGYIPLETIKLDTFTDKSGTTAYHLISAAKKYGFDAVGLEIDFQDLFKLKLPVIVHLTLKSSFNHFVVIYNIDYKKNIIKIMDPSSGFKKIKFQEFEDIWTHVCIELFPYSKLPILKSTKTLKDFMRNIVSGEIKFLVKIGLSNIIVFSLNIFCIFLIKYIFSNITNDLKNIISLYIIIIGLKLILTYLKNSYEIYLNKNIDLKVMLPFLSHILKLPLNIIKSKSTGEIITRISELNNLKDLFTKCFVVLFFDLVLAIFSAILLYNINTKLFLLLLIILSIYIIVGIFSNKSLYKRIAHNIDLETDFNNEVIEKVDNILSIKTLNRLDLTLKNVENRYCHFLKDNFDLNKKINKYDFFKNIVYEIGSAILIAYGIYLMLTSNLFLINLITFISLTSLIFNPIKNIIELLPRINYIKASFQRISEFLNLKEEKVNGIYNKFFYGDILINNLTFSYDEYNFVLKDFNLLIKKGSNIMLKGPSGCGKSTICKLLYRLYNYDTGSIMINNINILDYNLNTLRNNITYLAQSETLFTDTIYNNIVLDRKVGNKSFEQIMSICKIDEIVNKKPLRYETMLHDCNNISGGEIQRILLARALIKNSSILILDEALSEVEQNMEREILAKLLSTFKHKIIIYVSHHNNEDLFEQVINMGS